MEKYKIVTDSSSDVLSLSGVAFSSAPLKIITSNDEFVDNENLDVENMVDTLSKYKGKSSTSCPNPEDWLKAFGDAEYIFCVTITGTLSGSYNAACIAKEMYEGLYPNRSVFVLNSLTAGPEIKLIIEKTNELIKQGKDFDTICKEISKYRIKTGLVFMLESMRNLANNGRVSPITARAAGLLGIRVVGKASDKGDLEPLDKCRGEKKALDTIISRIKSEGHKVGKVKISHCFNECAAQYIREKLMEEFSHIQVEIYKCRGLCSYYAEKGGLLVGFEKC